jgi:Fic family protein
MLKPTYQLPELPPPVELETAGVMKGLAKASRALAELKGRAAVIPNQGILIDALALQEAKASSEVENIVTTQDELFQAELFPEGPLSPAAKEVARYRDALRLGFQRLQDSGGLIPKSTIIEMFQLLKGREEGFRATPGTALKNESTSEIVYVPPQDANEIARLMDALELFINNDESCALDPLIKMALIHRQFESIHPFSDGNGRIGRILNVLYLTKCRLLDIPILYLSRHITANKSDYYRLLQAVRDDGNWEPWLLYMLDAVGQTAETTLGLVEGIRAQMAGVKRKMRTELPKLYSQDLLNSLFRHPYTRIEYVQKELSITRQTASKYLDALAEKGFVEKHQTPRGNYYINTELVSLFLHSSGRRA